MPVDRHAPRFRWWGMRSAPNGVVQPDLHEVRHVDDIVIVEVAAAGGAPAAVALGGAVVELGGGDVQQVHDAVAVDVVVLLAGVGGLAGIDAVFDGAVGHSIFNIPGAETCAVEFFSLSKSFNVTGARISFLVGRRDVIAACKKLRTQIDFGKFIPEQKAAIAAMTGPLEPIKAQCAEYQRRRDALCGGFRSIGWDVPDSHGSMFVWAPVPQGHGTSMEFCMEMIEKAGVICTPGSSFGPSGEGYVRFALTLPVEKITEAVQAVKNSGLIG